MSAQHSAPSLEAVVPIDKLAWITLKDRKMLFVRSKGKDTFYNPGGKRETGETDEQALIREIKEELGVTLKKDDIKYAHTFQAQAHGKPEGVMVQMKCFWADYEGELRPTSEIEELAWLSNQDLERTSATGKMTLHWLKAAGYID